MKGILILGIILILVSFIGIIFFLINQFSNNGKKFLNNKNVSLFPIHNKEKTKNFNKNYQEEDEIVVERDKNGQITLRQKLIYADMKISPVIFIVIKYVTILAFACITYLKFSLFLTIVMGWVGGVLVDTYVNRKIQKRFKAFDNDYPVFLQSMASLLKSGMTPMIAFETAVENIEGVSILKQEVKKVLDKLRAGISEDIAVGGFASTINHPEIELFIQAILLGKNLGGSLSSTLDRVAEQARKKQFFRSSAISAIAQQRGSMYVVMGLLIGTVVFMGIKTPDIVLSLFESSTGNLIIEFAIFANILGIYLMNKSSKIKV